MKLREMNDWKISNDTLKLGVELGRGSFGIVMAAEWRHTPVALKILFADAQADDRVLFEKEVKLMASQNYTVGVTRVDVHHKHNGLASLCISDLD